MNKVIGFPIEKKVSLEDLASKHDIDVEFFLYLMTDNIIDICDINKQGQKFISNNDVPKIIEAIEMHKSGKSLPEIIENLNSDTPG